MLRSKFVSLMLAALALFLVGCSAPPPKPKPLFEPGVRPIPIQLGLPTPVDDGARLADLLIEHYQQGPAYRMSLPVVLSGYSRDKTLSSPDRRHLMQLYQSGTAWGFVSISMATNPVLNAFELTDQQGSKSYALVLRNARICLDAGAARPPFWGGQSWIHSTVNPGKFECSGQTRGSLYQPNSGMPGRLGYYFASGDTVLYDKQQSRLQNIAALLSQRFVNLSIPEIR